MTTLFISDLHLQPSRPELSRALSRFLADKAAGADALYILGDLFEAWIGDDDDAPAAAELATRLRQLSDRGTRIFFQHGNRDFLLGNAYAERCGMTLLPEEAEIDLYGRHALLLHGDTLCTEDRDYMALRAQLRNPAWQQALLARPLDERRQLAASLREQSKAAGAMKSEEIMDVTPAEVERVMAAHGVDLLIHGHTHRPARHPLVIDGKPAERIVLGDWGLDLWWLAARPNGALALHREPISP
ncbi:MAG: UDP-2,3-diacylglucosamine diphosphatase [Spongiibacteraceae bacterium]|nr:UDP-2,3-diacylglucosamine diphosphatase [Spongiibacteraceae bacterium]